MMHTCVLVLGERGEDARIEEHNLTAEEYANNVSLNMQRINLHAYTETPK